MVHGEVGNRYINHYDAWNHGNFSKILVSHYVGDNNDVIQIKFDASNFISSDTKGYIIEIITRSDSVKMYFYRKSNGTNTLVWYIK